MPSIRTMKTFLAVTVYGSFAEAGRQIGLTPAAVGLQIRTLEESLGCQLFDRNNRIAVLNSSGRKLVPEIEELVKRYETLSAHSNSGSIVGTAVMGALVSALMGAFSDALRTVTKQHPGLDIRLLAGFSKDFSHRVANGELDAAVITEPPHPLVSNLQWSMLYSEPLVLIVPRGEAYDELDDAPAILGSSPFLRFDRNAWTGVLVEKALGQCGVNIRERMELNSVEAIIELVRQGFGVSIVPRLANVDWEQDRALRVIPLVHADVHRRVGLLERRDHTRMCFTDAIKDYFHSRTRQPGVAAGLSPSGNRALLVSSWDPS